MLKKDTTMDSIDHKDLRLVDQVSCVILAGGQGTRLFPLTKKKCKPAVRFGGRYRLIDIPISNAINSNLTHIYVISQYLASGLHQHITDTYVLDPFRGQSIELLSPEETPQGKIWYEGTADAVRKNMEHILKHPREYILILSGDQLYNMDLEKMVHYAKEKNADLTIASLPVGEKEASRLGILKVTKEMEVIDFIEKPQDPSLLEKFRLFDTPRYSASMGIYVFKTEALIRLLKEDPREDFGKHLIATQMKKGSTFTFLYEGYWEDIGTIASYYESNLALTTNTLGLNLYNEIMPIYSYSHNLPGPRVVGSNIKNSLLCDGCVIEAKEISHSIIGIRAYIQKGTLIEDSIILGHESLLTDTKEPLLEFSIGKDCVIKKAIIDENCTIGNRVQLINRNQLSHFDSDILYVREGIIVIPAGTTLPDGFLF